MVISVLLINRKSEQCQILPYTLSYYDTWAATEVNSLQVGIDPRQMNNTEEIILDALYCEVCGEISSGTQ
ncbi:MAG: hypothetical protein KC964_26440 [Candidatus Omnitrophica bacterium]|nr:hypothetical protein [Candidatus Omnitrophota bacterium]